MFLQAESTQRAKEQARAILDDVRWELDRQEAASPSPGHIQLDGETIDPELWAHVSTLVETHDWEKIPREAASFVEHRLRIWGDISPTVKGRVDVFKQALSEQHLPLGDAGAEQQGWVQIGVGFVLAVANSAHHKLNDRSDQRRYAVGVLGIASLILGEVRRRYSPRIEMAADANLGHPG